VDAAAAGFPVTVPAATGGTPSGVPTVNFVPQAGSSTVNTAVALDLDNQFKFFYLVIALGAGVAALASLLWRAKGGRA
jgi:hypothetical protein